MSVEAIAIVLHHSRAAGTAKTVLIGIANHDGDGGSWPSISTLAKYARVTERNVQKAIRDLVALGEIEVKPQAGGNHHTEARYRPNRYDIRVVCPSTCDRSASHRCAGDDDLAPKDRGVGFDTPHDLTGVSNVTPLRGVVSDASGVSPATPEPSLEPTTPQPPASGGRSSCTKPGVLPHANCRACGTTSKQLEAKRRESIEAERREQAKAELAAQRAAKAANRAEKNNPNRLAAIAAAKKAARSAR